jgi:isoquinoline 1-oxidoreductase subunit alpha
MVEVIVNGERRQVDVPGDTPLLWVLRDELGLLGTKYGCGVGACGACAVLHEGTAVRSCQVPIRDAAGQRYTTVEGLSREAAGRACQAAWIEEDVSQCGYCQAGMLITAVALLRRSPNATDREIDAAMDDSVCRCGSYPRMRRAIHAAARATAAQ